MPIIDFPRRVFVLTQEDIRGSQKERGRKAKLPAVGAYLLVPPFHTGGVGLLPGTEVSTFLTKQRLADNRRNPREPSHCEFYISPIQDSYGDIFRLECIVMDRPGSVGRVIEAVADLDLNIIRQSSCMINDGELHYVDLLIDWSYARHGSPGQEATRSGKQFRYRTLASRMPIGQARYARLYEQIMVRCADIVITDSAQGYEAPHIIISPFSHRRREDMGATSVLTAASVISAASSMSLKQRKAIQFNHKLHVAVRLPESAVREVLNYTGFKQRAIERGRVQFVLVSDSDSFTLRVYFPSKRQENGLLHFGVLHRNRPSSVNVASKLIARAGFNVVTSLVRPVDPSWAIWEVLVEQQREELAPELSSTPEVREKLRDLLAVLACDGTEERRVDKFAPPFGKRMTATKKTLAPIAAHLLGADDDCQGHLLREMFEISLCPPLYPRQDGKHAQSLEEIRSQSHRLWDKKRVREANAERKDATGELDGSETSSADTFRRAASGAFLRSRLKVDTADRVVLERANAQYQAYDEGLGPYVREVLGSIDEPRPRVFLSYAWSAVHHAELVRREHVFQKHLRIVSLQDAAVGSEITTLALERIRQCDYFLGLWHHESNPDGTKTVSPWMPFEYGTALAHSWRPVDTVVVHSDQLGENITRRINQGISQPSYSDLSFETHMIPRIREHCYEFWLEGTDLSGCEECATRDRLDPLSG